MLLSVGFIALSIRKAMFRPLLYIIQETTHLSSLEESQKMD
ncbi:MAG: hypothetical protein JWN18_682 [Parcubacteria group bacterium]|nr:hypothetical protein [Parcubacteria group bacterium]